MRKGSTAALGAPEAPEALAAAVAAAVEREAFSPPASRSSSSRRALRLAATRRALVFDALAVAAGVRTGAMLDYCPGLEPGAAAEVAKAASASAALPEEESLFSSPDPGAAVVAAHLDGCCYLLNSRLLGAEPPSPPPPLGAKTLPLSSAAGAFSGTAPWPIVFRGQPLAPAWGQSDVEGRELAASLAALAPTVRSAAVEAGRKRAASSSSSSPCVFVVDLGSMPSLPTAPALNAFLLGYPVAYCVGSREEAALASKALRFGSRIGNGESSSSSTSRSTTLALVTLTARALAGASNPCERTRLCSFSVPMSLWDQMMTTLAETEKEEGEEGEEGEEEEEGGESDGFVSLWAESVRASAVGCEKSRRPSKTSGASHSSSSLLECLFRGEGIKVSVEFVDSGGVTM